ncbi:ribonuclease H-like domain-containing protein [Tanacetum coccineum]
MFLSQHKYAVEILDRNHMVNYNPSQTPDDSEPKLGDDDDPQVCLYMHDPREPHFSALKRILRYIRGTLDYGLQLFSSSTSYLVAYLDADWVGFPTTRRSTLEAEYHGVANAAVETCWLRNLLRELHTPLSSDTLVYCDIMSAVYLSSNPVQHQRTKHIDIDIHFVGDVEYLNTHKGFAAALAVLITGASQSRQHGKSEPDLISHLPRACLMLAQAGFPSSL